MRGYLGQNRRTLHRGPDSKEQHSRVFPELQPGVVDAADTEEGLEVVFQKPRMTRAPCVRGCRSLRLERAAA